MKFCYRCQLLASVTKHQVLSSIQGSWSSSRNAQVFPARIGEEEVSVGYIRRILLNLKFCSILQSRQKPKPKELQKSINIGLLVSFFDTCIIHWCDTTVWRRENPTFQVYIEMEKENLSTASSTSQTGLIYHHGYSTGTDSLSEVFSSSYQEEILIGRALLTPRWLH